MRVPGVSSHLRFFLPFLFALFFLLFLDCGGKDWNARLLSSYTLRKGVRSLAVISSQESSWMRALRTLAACFIFFVFLFLFFFIKRNDRRNIYYLCRNTERQSLNNAISLRPITQLRLKPLWSREKKSFTYLHTYICFYIAAMERKTNYFDSFSIISRLFL